MSFFRWNSFTVIGLILILIGIYGLIKGPGFQFDAGLPPEQYEGFYYIIVGLLMTANGLVVPKAIPVEVEPAPAAKSDAAKRSSQPGAPVQTK